MTRLEELRAERIKLEDSMLTIKSEAEANKRALEPNDYEKINSICDQIEAIDKSIDTEVRMENASKKGNEKEERQVKDSKIENPNGVMGFRSLGEYLQAVIAAGSELNGRTIGEFQCGVTDKRLYTQVGVEKRASGMSANVPHEGGFAITTDFSTEMLKRTWEAGSIASKVRRIPISTNANGIKIPAIKDYNRADGSRFGGLRAYWKNEAGTLTGSQPDLELLELSLEKLTGLIYLTDELIQDASALEAYVLEMFPYEFAFKIEDALFNGDGAGKPLGIKGAACTVSVAKETSQAASTLVTENIVKMFSRMWVPSMKKAEWYLCQDTIPQLYTMNLAVGTGGGPVFLPNNSLANAPFGTLIGRPINYVEQCETLGTTGDIYFADFSQYIMIEKGGMQQASSMHVKFTTDEMALRFILRLDGEPMWSNVATPFKGTSNTVSPFVKLDTRA